MQIFVETAFLLVTWGNTGQGHWTAHLGPHIVLFPMKATVRSSNTMVKYNILQGNANKPLQRKKKTLWLSAAWGNKSESYLVLGANIHSKVYYIKNKTKQWKVL